MTLNQKYMKRILLTLFSMFFALWIFANYVANDSGHYKTVFFDSYWTIIIIGIIAGYYSTISWGSHRSILGKSLLSFTIGLALQIFGQITFSILYSKNHGAVPYPGLPDFGFFGSIPFYCYGAYYMAKSAGARRALHSVGGVLVAVVIPMIMLSVTVGMFLYGKTVDWSNPLMTLLDFGYPLGQAIYMILAMLTYLLSSEWLGGKLRISIIFIVLGLITQYLADSTFLYQNMNVTWGPGGVSDLIYLFAYFFISYGLIDFWEKYSFLKLNGSSPK